MTTKTPKKHKHVKREFTDQMGGKLRRLKISHGSHGSPRGIPSDRKVCIMEAISAITGQAEVEGLTDGPVCVSAVLQNAMIDLNDSGLSERGLSKLKKAVPDLIGTAPVYATKDYLWDEKEQDYIEATVFRTDSDDPRYHDAEVKRRKALTEFENKYDSSFGEADVPLDEKLAFIKKLAKIKGTKPKAAATA